MSADEGRQQPRTRDEAISKGSRTYFTGKPCSNGHLEVRFVANWACSGCARARSAEVYALQSTRNKVREKFRVMSTQEGFKEMRKERAQVYNASEGGKRRGRAYSKKYRLENPERLNAMAQRRLEALPDSYVRKLLIRGRKGGPELLSSGLIEIKRLQIQIKRYLKEIQE